jgi:hypothetical protein
VIADVAQCTDMGAACSTWTYLYNCYFGPVGHANCSAQSQCHASSSSTGTQLGYGFECGSTSDTCWKGMTVNSAPPLVPTVVSDPKTTILYTALHKTTGMATPLANNMPLKTAVDFTDSAYSFTPAQLACIEGWLKAGAKED